MRICPRGGLQRRRDAEVLLALFVGNPYLERQRRAPVEPHRLAGAEVVRRPGAVAVLREIYLPLAWIVDGIDERDGAVRSNGRLPLVGRIEEAARVEHGPLHEILAPGRPRLAPRHLHLAHELRRILRDHRVCRTLFIGAHVEEPRRRNPLRRRREPVLDDLPFRPSLKIVVVAVHDLVFDNAKVGEVVLPLQDRQLQERHERGIDPFGKRDHLLGVLDDRALGLVHVRRVASAASKQPRRRVVQDVVAALAEGLHARVAAAVAHEQTLVRRRVEDAADAPAEQPTPSRHRRDPREHAVVQARRAVLADPRDAAAVEAGGAHDPGDLEAELLLLQVVAHLLAGLRVDLQAARLHERPDLERARHVVCGELKRLEHALDARRVHVDVVPHVVRLVDLARMQPDSRANYRRHMLRRRREHPLPVPEKRKIAVPLLCVEPHQLAVGHPARRPVRRAERRHLLARMLRAPDVAPGAERERDVAAPEVAHHGIKRRAASAGVLVALAVVLEIPEERVVALGPLHLPPVRERERSAAGGLLLGLQPDVVLALQTLESVHALVFGEQLEYLPAVSVLLADEAEDAVELYHAVPLHETVHAFERRIDVHSMCYICHLQTPLKSGCSGPAETSSRSPSETRSTAASCVRG